MNFIPESQSRNAIHVSSGSTQKLGERIGFRAPQTMQERDQMLDQKSVQNILPGALLLLFILVAVARAVLADQSTPQGFDEPCHIAAGIKWLDQHDYTLDALHPPLSRYAIAFPLYIYGERFPKIHPQDTGQSYCTEIGNAILSDGGHYARNLFLARMGILPFLCLAVLFVFLWGRFEFGMVAGCIAAFLFSTLPSVLAFSSLAYTDVPTMCTQFAFLFAFVLWLKKTTMIHALLLGASAGLALSSKLTSFLFLPLACAAMLLVKFWLCRDGIKFKLRWAGQLAAALCISLVILWGSYAFSRGHLQDALGQSPSSILSSPPRGLASRVVEALAQANPVIPAPDLVRGIELARHKNSHEPETYLLGTAKPGGWWYFFPLALALKTPLPFSILAIIGFVYTVRSGYRGDWSALMPGAASAGILISTLFVTLRVGTRHVLVLLPLLALVAGYGGSRLWRIPGQRQIWVRLALCLLLTWQATASIRAQDDFLAYFNELAPADPSEALVKGCDLDCGQDVFRLSRELRVRHVTHVSMGIWTSADLAQIDLPPFEILLPHKPVTGWIAVSLRGLKTGQFGFFQNGRIVPEEGYPDDSLSWLNQYRPVAHVGKTILLFEIPGGSPEKVTQANP